jgi:hypothetical protein
MQRKRLLKSIRQKSTFPMSSYFDLVTVIVNVRYCVWNIVTIILKMISHENEELDGPTVSLLRRVIAEIKKRCSAIGWVIKNVLSRAPPCFGRHVKPLGSRGISDIPPRRSLLPKCLYYEK